MKVPFHAHYPRNYTIPDENSCEAKENLQLNRTKPRWTVEGGDSARNTPGNYIRVRENTSDRFEIGIYPRCATVPSLVHGIYVIKISYATVSIRYGF